MTDETRLKEKLHAIEALFAGATTPGERDAAGGARRRIMERLAKVAAEAPVEWQYTRLNPWERRLLIALGKRYGLKPFRYKGQRRTTLAIKGPRSFIEEVFCPEYERMAKLLFEHLDEVAKRVIDEVLETEPAPSPQKQQLSLLDEPPA